MRLKRQVAMLVSTLGSIYGKLTTLSQMASKDMLRAFDEILRVLKTGEDFKKFLYFLGNLDSIGICLLHNDKHIQQRAYQLLHKLKA